MKLLKVAQVIEKLNISKGKAYAMIKKGVIPSVNIDGCIRVPEEVLEEMIFRQLKPKIKGKSKIRVENVHVLSSGSGREGGKQ